MKTIEKAYRALHTGMIVLAMASLVAMTLITFVNVALRYAFDTALRWGEELTLVLVAWFTFIAFTLGVTLDIHINVNLLPSTMPRWLSEALARLKHLAVLAAGVVFLVYGLILVDFASRSILPATELPASVMYLPMPIASIFLLHDGVYGLLGKTLHGGTLERIFKGGCDHAE
jgi:TRAP-type C4-dicarboxylate transport system permease small subunit